MWGPGAANRGLSGTLARWYVWRVSGSQVAGVHRLLSLQGTSRGGEGCETRSPVLATRDPGPSSSFDSGSRGVDVRRASGPDAWIRSGTTLPSQLWPPGRWPTARRMAAHFDFGGPCAFG